MNFRKADVTLQQHEGFFDVVKPEFNTETQRLGEIYFDEPNEVFTYPVNDIPQAELEERKQRELDMLDRRFDNEAAKIILRKVAEPLLQDEGNLTGEILESAKMLYKQWRVGKIYDKNAEDIDKRRFVYEGTVYKVIGAEHTSQADWSPDKATSLYAKYRPIDVITVYEPQSAETAYMTGEMVYFPTAEDDVYKSLIDNNVWSPSAYPAGWELQ